MNNVCHGRLRYLRVFKKKYGEIPEMIVFRICHVLGRAISFFLFPIKAVGLENVPVHGGCILACNHISNLDPISIGIVFRNRKSYLAKDSLFKNKFLGWFIRCLGGFPIKREMADISALKEILRRLKIGETIVMFPEGSRFKDRQHPRDGIGFIAQKSKAPVVPVRILGTEKVLPPGARVLRKNSITIVFGKPLLAVPSESYSDISSRIVRSIYALQE